MRHHPLSLFALLVVSPLCSEAAVAQAPGAHWSITTVTTPMPPLRRESPGVADLTGMYVFGGIDMTTSARRSDLWRFDGAAWTQLSADADPSAPPARAQCAIAYDFARARLVVFGGHDGTLRLGDTWEWDGLQWTNLTPASGSPSARNFGAMAYDWIAGKVLLFGGNDGAYKSDTWQWDGSSWTQLAPATVPAARQQHGLASRLDSLDILMCCGQNASTRFGDTWRWNGADWTQIVTATLPIPRVALDVTYDEVRQRLVIPGGNNSAGNPIGSIAEFDGIDWVNRPQDAVIAKRTRYFLAFVPALGKSYMFGGQQVSAAAPALTYEYQTDHVAAYTVSGTGCTGTIGVPQLSATGKPWLGSTTTVSVFNAGSTEVVFMITGLDNGNWMGNPLPMNGAALGAPNCTLYVAPLAFLFLGVGANVAPIDLVIPNDVAFLGLSIFNQAVVMDAVAGIGASALGTARIGAL